LFVVLPLPYIRIFNFQVFDAKIIKKTLYERDTGLIHGFTREIAVRKNGGLTSLDASFPMDPEKGEKCESKCVL